MKHLSDCQPVTLLAKLNNDFLQSDNLSLMDVSVLFWLFEFHGNISPHSLHANVIPESVFNGF